MSSNLRDLSGHKINRMTNSKGSILADIPSRPEDFLYQGELEFVDFFPGAQKLYRTFIWTYNYRKDSSASKSESGGNDMVLKHRWILPYIECKQQTKYSNQMVNIVGKHQECKRPPCIGKVQVQVNVRLWKIEQVLECKHNTESVDLYSSLYDIVWL